MPAPTRAEKQAIKDEFEGMLREASRNWWAPDCVDRPEEFIDYTQQPTAEEAEMSCAACPMRELCDQFAQVERPGWGIWGGKRWRYGKLVPVNEVEELAA
jgi:hypothetical protein